MKGIVTKLLGMQIRPRPDLMNVWGWKPDPTGEFFAEIEAVWVEDGSVKILASGPAGDLREGYLAHYELSAGYTE